MEPAPLRHGGRGPVLRPYPVRALALALALALAPGGGRAADDRVTLTLPQAHALAQQAFASGDMAFAHALALRLLEANPKDPRALLLIAATAPALGDPARGRTAGREAWAAAKDAPLLRYEIARFTAVAAVADNRPGAAQFWLRRAADVAPNADAAARTAADYRRIRAARRLSYNIDVSATPTSNVNGGASGDALVVNGTLPLGSLSGDAQALSGITAAARVSLVWKLPETPTTRARVGLRAYATANRLSDDAKDLAPDAEGKDFNFAVLEATAGLDWKPEALLRPLQLSLGAGKSWYGGEVLGDHLRGEVGWHLIATPQGVIRVSLGAERQWRDTGMVNALTWRVEGGRSIGDAGDKLIYGLALKRVAGEARNTEHTAATLDLGYDFARPVGPALLSLRATAGMKDYPFYSIGLLGIRDGREDLSAGLSVEAAFPALQRFGYMPKVTLSAEETRSNISRFETRNIGLSVGFASSF